jgi:hypothetical protein
MKAPSLLILAYCWLAIVGACHSKPAPASNSGDDSSRIDPSRSVGHKSAGPPIESRDSMREAARENYDTLDPTALSHFRDIQAFLEFVKRPDSTTNVGFNEWIKDFRVGNIDSFLNFLTIDSLEIDDAGADPGKDSVKYSRSLVHGQLKRRKGPVFDMIGEISLSYSIPYPQYSHTIFAEDKNDSVPNLNVRFSEFVLYFRPEKGSPFYKLYRLESDHIPDL